MAENTETLSRRNLLLSATLQSHLSSHFQIPLYKYLSVCSIRKCKIFYSNNFSELMHGKVAGGDNKPFVYFSFAEIAQ